MALLNTFVDKRVLSPIAASGSVTFAHGLLVNPDIVTVYENDTTGSSVGIRLAITHDGTNVIINNYGSVATATLEVITQVFHSLIR